VREEREVSETMKEKTLLMEQLRHIAYGDLRAEDCAINLQFCVRVARAALAGQDAASEKGGKL